MSDLTTRKMLAVFEQLAPEPPAFFAGMFEARPENFHNTEEVEIDILRNDEDIAIAIQDMSVGADFMAAEVYTNKSFKPPVFKPGFVLDQYKLMERQPGVNPFGDVNFQAAATVQFARKMRKAEAMIQRSIELQAAQVLQTGVVTLTDATGATRYTIDFKMKATHKPQVAVSWATIATATPIADLNSLCEVIRNDGKVDPDMIVCGVDAFDNAMRTTDFRNRMDNRRIDMGSIVPQQLLGAGASYRGQVDIGSYKLDVYTYNGKYKNPNGGAMTRFLNKDYVVVANSGIRLDATYGNIPNIVPPSQRVLPYIPPRIQRVGRGGVDLITNVWCSPSGEQLFGSVGARPLLIPTQIDGYGCLNTVQP